MDQSDVIYLIGIALTVAYAGYQQIRGNKLQADKDNNRAQWNKIDELRAEVSNLKDHMRTEYMTGRQVQEYFRLSTEAWIVKLDHIDKRLDSLCDLLEKRLGTSYTERR